ncbi:hypothetical protein DFJ77DRAFT_298418 [Powellomyces hirtus]|nr:hypothetical protein DFJ77DRAFT_298418 [Powellomyces hirtus]
MYGLSEDIVTAYSRCGITSLYPWQAECLQLDGVLAGSRNLLYSAPTSGGKSLVADIVMLQKVMSTRRKAIMIVPFVALASERTKVMQTVFSSERLKIVGYYSDVGSTSFDNVDIGYCTIEKANSLINRLIEERKLETLGIVVVDEVHMAGDPQRGYLLELLLTKLLFILAGDLQIVGMSATLPNINIFKDWLSAHLYITAFRPVPLTEYIKFEGNLYDSKGQLLQNLGKANSKDPDFVVPLVRHTLLESASVLIFCPGSKRYCENTAKLLALQLPACNDPAILTQRRGVVRELERTPGGLDLDLATFVTAGVAFHHSGLMTEEKEIIEDAYRSGIVKVIACTSTLAMGVNLPARRVIFRDLKKYKKELLTPREYQQMRGRAGRKGLDAHGESIIMCSDKTEFEAARNLISSELHPVTSCLLTDRKGMKRAVLEVVVAGVANSLEDLKTYLKSTLLHAELGHFDSGTVKCLLNAVAFLKEHDFVEQSLDGRLAATRLGCAAVYSSLSPEEALVVYGELRRASSRFSLSEDLHTVYLVTPVYMEEKYVSWARYAQLYAELVGDENRKNVADLIGISEAALYRAHRRQGWEPEHMPESRAVHKRFYIAMILSDLVQEKPFDAILHKYGGISRGDLQSLQSQSGSFAGMVKIFCQQLGWENLVAVVDKFQDRLQFGVSADLVELMQVPEIGGVRARLLYAEGYKDITALACASPEAICEALRKGSPFNPADKDRDAQRRLLFRAAHLISQGALKVVQAQLKEAAIEAQRKRSLLARVRELRTPPSTSPQSEGSTSSKESRVSRFSVGRKPRYSGESELPCPNVEGTASRTVSHLALTQGPIMLNAVNDDKASRIGHKFKVITVTKTPATFSEFIRQWATKDMYAWSCRGNPLGREILSLSVCWDFETVHHMDIESPHFHWTDARKVFGKRSIKVTFDAKFQLRYLMHNDVMPVPTFWDPKVAAWLLEPDSDERSLQTLFDATFPLYRASTADRMAEPTCSRAAWQALKLMGSLADRLQRQGLDDHFKGVEMPMAPILAKMEHVGIGFVEQVFSGYDGVFKTALRDLEAEAHTITGHPFSLTEPREVGKVLYDELRLPYDEMLSPMMRREDDRKRALGKAVYRRTCKEVLTKLTDHHPLPAIIMEHRRLSMLITAHLLPLRMASAMSVEFQMARVSCTLQTHTATGRMIAINPNLQNLPHPRSNGDGRAIDSLDLRNSFRAAEGMTFVSADYNQIELRIIAHLAEDENLISLIRSGGDFFNLLASQIFEKRLEAVTKEERQKAKALTYGVILETAFPGIPEWKRRTVESCYDFGYVETMLGRRRYLPAIHSKSALERSHAERQSINTTVQGSAADLIKVAMTHVDKRFREKRWGSWIGDRTDPRLCPLLLLPIHDELIFEVPIGLLDIIRPIIRDCMEKTCEMRVPLNVRLKVGQIWGQMREEED